MDTHCHALPVRASNPKGTAVAAAQHRIKHICCSVHMAAKQLQLCSCSWQKPGNSMPLALYNQFVASTQCQRVPQQEKPCSSCTLNFSKLTVSKGIHKMCWQRSSTVVSNQQPDKSALPCSRLATCLQEASLCVAGSSCALSHRL